MNKLINIITRTHNRPDEFQRLSVSLLKQTYSNYNWIVGSDVKCPYYPDAIRLMLDIRQPVDIPKGKYFAPWNLHLNELQKHVKEGYLIYLDDDDEFTNEKSLKRIANACEEDVMVIWKVQIFPNMIVPSHSFNKYVAAGDFSGIGFAFHSKWLPLDWGNISYGDYRVAYQLIQKGVKIKWLDMMLTKTQNGARNGR